jgi:hypothetical protein
MSKKRKSKKVYGDKSHYWRPENRLLLIDFFCIENALEFSTKAKEIYTQILEIWERPGCQALLKGNIIMPISEL